MTILQLKYFQTVYQCLNMTRAANLLYVSQPSVSAVIQELEEEFQTKLFLRTKPLQPTQAGRQLALLVEPLLKNFDDIAHEMRQFGSQNTPLRIGVSVISQQLMQYMFGRDLDYQTDALDFLGFYGCDYLFQCIHDSRLDLAIVATADVKELQAFNYYNLAAFGVRFYTNKKNPLCSFSTLDPQQLQNTPLAAFTEYPMSKMEFGELMNTLLGNSYTDNVQFFSTDLRSIEQAIESGRVSCVLLEGLFASNPQIRAISLETNKRIHFSVIWRKDHFLQQEELEFIQEFEKKFQA
ncbi:MAG TPA: LysR family transcriptional regulator [Candidatus Lachnoclostridium pullistercoris]|uniref:LysR family transcriptional regulator n=1 Tax=Candidatus Lachnoclostridium pullistercoris TaxID=2838632 RepID=A0A9D2T5T8_9FIRM|nr:LysR family transcriptional regulator [Candidatus Lachnoclostridium pullistercoris]